MKLGRLFGRGRSEEAPRESILKLYPVHDGEIHIDIDMGYSEALAPEVIASLLYSGEEPETSFELPPEHEGLTEGLTLQEIDRRELDDGRIEKQLGVVVDPGGVQGREGYLHVDLTLEANNGQQSERRRIPLVLNLVRGSARPPDMSAHMGSAPSIRKGSFEEIGTITLTPSAAASQLDPFEGRLEVISGDPARIDLELAASKPDRNGASLRMALGEDEVSVSLRARLLGSVSVEDAFEIAATLRLLEADGTEIEVFELFTEAELARVPEAAPTPTTAMIAPDVEKIRMRLISTREQRVDVDPSDIGESRDCGQGNQDHSDKMPTLASLEIDAHEAKTAVRLRVAEGPPELLGLVDEVRTPLERPHTLTLDLSEAMLEALPRHPERERILINVEIRSDEEWLETARVVISACRQNAAPNAVAIDFGASSIAIAIWEIKRGMSVVKIGAVLDAVDHDPDSPERGESMIPSAVGLTREGWWRGEMLPQTALLAANPASRDPFSPDAFLAAKPERTYLTALPVVPASAATRPEVAILAAPKMRILSDELKEAELSDDVRRMLVEADIPVQRNGRIEKSRGELLGSEILRDIFDEIGDGYIHGDDLKRCEGARIILTCPCLFSASQRKALSDAARGFAETVGANVHNIAIAPEPLAAALDLCETRPIPRSGDRPHRILAFDVGAGTLDIAAIEGQWEPRAERFTTWRQDASIGLPIGGDYIDRMLAAMVDAHLHQIAPGAISPSAQGAIGQTEPGAAAKRLFHPNFPAAIAQRLCNNIKRAKARLATDVAKQAGPGKPLIWGGERVRFNVRVDSIVEDVGQLEKARKSGATTLLRKGADIGLKKDGGLEGDDARGVYLSLDRNDMSKSRAMRDLMEAMTDGLLHDFIDGLRSEWPQDYKFDEVVVSGRGSLWPPLREQLAEFIKDMPERFAHTATMHSQEHDPGALKLAVARGAVRYATREFDQNFESPDNSALTFGVLVDDVGVRKFIEALEGEPFEIPLSGAVIPILSCSRQPFRKPGDGDDEGPSGVQKLLETLAVMVAGEPIELAYAAPCSITLSRPESRRRMEIEAGGQRRDCTADDARLSRSAVSAWPYATGTLPYEEWWDDEYLAGSPK